MRPEIFIYALATALVLMGVVVALVFHVQVAGLGFFLMGALLFLLPSMRKPRRRL